jgi:hypothetical protein
MNRIPLSAMASLLLAEASGMPASTRRDEDLPTPRPNSNWLRRLKDNPWNPLRPRNERVLAKFATLGRQQVRADLLRSAVERVNDANPNMGRKHRRALARAYAAGAWREMRARREGATA